MLQEVKNWIRNRFIKDMAMGNTNEVLNLEGLRSPGVNGKPAKVEAVPVIDCGTWDAPPSPTTEVTLPAVQWPQINWNEEQRIDLPPRSPEMIQRLLQFESPERTAARIRNDCLRYRRQRGLL